MVAAQRRSRDRRPGWNTSAPLSLLAWLLLLGGCASLPSQHEFRMPAIDPASGANQVWPALPEVPRYAFVGHLRGESNAPAARRNGNVFSRFLAILVGLGADARDALDLLRPQQVASDRHDRLYVVDTGRQAVFVFDETSGEFALWNESELGVPLASPVGLAVLGDSIWVTDSELARVYRFDTTGAVTGRIDDRSLRRPTGIAVDAAGQRLFVSDTAAGQVRVFDLDGRALATWGRPGGGPGEFNRPTFLAYRDGRLYVADSLNARVQVLDDDGGFLRSIGQRGLFVGNLSRPKGVATDSDGNLYVVESYYDHVLIYDPRGELLLAIGGSGAAAGQFSQPTGIWVDARDRVFVSDMLNARVSVFQYLGGN